MSNRTPVLVGHDGHSLGPLRTGEMLARVLEVPLTIATAYDYEPVAWSARAIPAAVNDQRQQHATALAERALSALDAPQQVDCRVVPAAGRSAALLDLAHQVNAACVVVGPDLRGGVTRSVLAHATSPVVVAPAEALLIAAAPGTIGIAYDGSPPSRFALTAAAQLAARAGATLRILTVADRLPTSHAADLVSHAAAHVAPDIDLDTHVLHGRAAAELRRACEDLDLLACGTHGRGRLQAALLGSVSSQLVDDPVCPVLVIPPRVRRRASTPLRVSTAGETPR